jgi:hypothetical protein
MKTQNFTQFCAENNFPSDYDTMFEAQLLGGRGLAGRISKRRINSQDAKFHEMQTKNKEAHELFYNSVKNGLIIDADGRFEMNAILTKEHTDKIKDIESKIIYLQRYIDMVNGLSTISHLKNGKLKKGYQLAVNDHLQKIDVLKIELNKLNS